MTINELIELASEAREDLGGDAEVRIASQPGYPLASLAYMTIPHSTDPSGLAKNTPPAVTSRTSSLASGTACRSIKSERGLSRTPSMP